MNFLKSIAKYMSPYKKRYFFGILALIVVDVATLLSPQILRNLANDFEMGTLTNNNLIKYALFVIMIGAFVGMGRFFWRIYIFGSGRTIEYDLRKEVFNHWLTLDQNFFINNKTGDLMSYATNDINQIIRFTGDGIMTSVDSTFMLFFTVFMMIKTTGFKFTLLSLAPLPLIVLLTIFFGRIFHRLFQREADSWANLTDVVQESFSGIGVVKAFLLEDHVCEKFREANQNFYNTKVKTIKSTSFFFPLMMFISGICYLIITYFGAQWVINSKLQLGDFIAHYTYLGLITWPVRGLGITINIIQRGAASLERVKEILKVKSQIKILDDPIHLGGNKIDVTFKNVSFKYPKSKINAVSNIDFSIPNGKTVALIGKTGSGKSTIAKLLFRQYDVTEGQILINNNSIKTIDLKDFSSKTGYVPQDNFLFSDSIKENIAFSFDEYPGDEHVIDASKKSGVFDDINSFKYAFDTEIGERGVTLSGGQKQRISISRAIIKKPSLLILDDSLSAVDTETEKKILDELKLLESSVLIIAHRISTIKHADEILFLEDGRIVERGTHDELVKLNGKYNQMYEHQKLESEITKEV